MTTSELYCPQCGYHVGTLRASEVKAAQTESGEYVTAVVPQMTRFLTDCTVSSPASLIATSKLRDAYEEWCRQHGEPIVSKQAFGRALRAAGVQPYRTGGSRFYLGLKLP